MALTSLHKVDWQNVPEGSKSMRRILARRAWIAAAAVIALGLSTLGVPSAGPASAATQSVTRPATQDTYIDRNTTGFNGGVATTLKATDYTYRALVQWDTRTPTGATLNSATLRVFVTANVATTGGMVLHPAVNTWSETSTTWANQPTWNAATFLTTSRPAPNQWLDVTIPLTRINQTGDTSFGVRYSATNSGFAFASRESANKPTLILNYTVPDPTPSPTASPSPTPTPSPTPPPSSDGPPSEAIRPTTDTWMDRNDTGYSGGDDQELSATDFYTMALLKFDTKAARPERAVVVGGTLWLYVTNNAASQGGFRAYPAATNWDENTTFATRPLPNNRQLGMSPTPQTGKWVSVPLPMGGINGNGTTALEVRYSNGGSQTRFASSENPQLAPRLQLNYRARVMFAGDTSCDPAGTPTPTNCRDMDVSDIAVSEGDGLTAMITGGDSQYADGTEVKFQSAFMTTYGRLLDRLHPVVGNHEYQDPAGDAHGYCAAMNEGAQTGRAGECGKFYYSRKIGSWDVYVLNSECGFVPGGCGVGSPQYTWLESQLGASTATCSLVAWHQPRFTNAGHVGQLNMGPLWNLAAQNGVDVALAGHSHSTEILKPIGVTPVTSQDAVLSATGMQEFVVGSGGTGFVKFNGKPPVMGTDGSSAVIARDDTTFGLLELTLDPTGYSYTMRAAAGLGQYTNADAQTTGAFAGSRNCN